MSAQDTTASVSNMFRLDAIIRIAAIVVGIGSATLLAHSALGIRFNEDFLLILRLVENTVGLIVLPFELLFLNPFVHWLHAQGIEFQLYPHWKNVFVLLWLLYAAVQRAVSPVALLAGQEGIKVAFHTASRWVWVAFAALIGGSLAGTATLNDPAILWWGMTGYFVAKGGDDLIYAFHDRNWAASGVLGLGFAAWCAALGFSWLEPTSLEGRPTHLWWALAAYFAFVGVANLLVSGTPRTLSGSLSFFVLVVVFVLTMALAVGVLQSPAWIDLSNSPSPGLANLAAFILITQAYSMLMGVSFPKERTGGYFVRVFEDTGVRIALDVLGVLGSAAIITYLAHLLA